VRPEDAGIGATPACMAKQASERNRATFAVSPTIFAVVRPPAPGKHDPALGGPSRGNLPAPTTPLVGRTAELAAVREGEAPSRYSPGS
jgi:hypothetical protein